MKCRRYVRGALDPALLLIGADIFTVHGSVARCEPWPDLHICTTMHKSSPGCPNLFMSAFGCTDKKPKDYPRSRRFAVPQLVLPRSQQDEGGGGSAQYVTASAKKKKKNTSF